jgi:hypothetical protein
MPVPVQGSPYTTGMSGLSSKFDYDYPDKLDLRPGSKLHEKIKQTVMECANESNRIMQDRFYSWNKIDESLTAYIPVDDAEQKVKDNDDRRPVSIVVPYSYATMETVLTYLVAAFLQNPIFRYEGTGPEDIIGAIMLEQVINNQSRRAKVGLQIHTMLRDALAYGIGGVTPVWREEWGLKTRMVDQPKFSLFGMNVGTMKVQKTIEEMIYEGNVLDNIDPYRYLPDPSYGIEQVQRGEYVGWIETTGYMDLLGREKNDPDLFNVKYLGLLSSRRSAFFGTDESARDRKNGGSRRDQITETVSKPTDIIHMFKKIIPRELGLPGSDFNKNGEYPEKWYFAIGADQIILAAKPLGLNHNLFPVCTCAPDFDGRSVTPISRLEIVHGLQHVLNFMFNSHIANVRKSINDMLIVDPWLVNMGDLRTPKPGKLIRLRKSAWGRANAAKDAVQQLQVTDITANNMKDAQIIMDMIERASAGTLNMMGVMRPGSERRSATEFEGTHQGAMNRLERIARVIGMQAMQDIAFMFASHTQQLMSENMYVRITGENEKRMLSVLGNKMQDGRIHVSPLDLAIDYDIIPSDGTVPGGNFNHAYVDMLQSVGSSEILASRIDVFKLFRFVMLQSGAKNVDDFELRQQAPQIPPINANVMPDEQVQKEVQSGNLIPAQAA